MRILLEVICYLFLGTRLISSFWSWEIKDQTPDHGKSTQVMLPCEATSCPLPLEFFSFSPLSHHPFSIPTISKSGVPWYSDGLFLLNVYADLLEESSGVIWFSDKYMQTIAGWMPRSACGKHSRLIDWDLLCIWWLQNT